MPHILINPTLIVIGGFAGAGKSTLARSLGEKFSIPVFEKDQVAKNLRKIETFRQTGLQADGITFDFFFAFAKAHLNHGGSLIFDQNMGREFTWRTLERLKSELPDHVTIKIFILDCSWELCLSRFAGRTEHPNVGEITLADLEDHKFKWEFLNENELPQAIRVDGSQLAEKVLQDVLTYFE